MKRIISISSAGLCEVSAAAEHCPPLGLTLPTGQDVQTSTPSGRTFGTLFSASDPGTIPNGVEIHIGSKRYEYVDGTAFDADTFADVSANAVSGVIVLRNLSPNDIGITW